MNSIHMAYVVPVHSKCLPTELACEVLLPSFPGCVFVTALNTTKRMCKLCREGATEQVMGH